MRTRTGGKVTPEQAVAYRVAAHNLHERLPAGGLLDAAAVVGAQDTPPGTAAISLACQVARLTPGAVETALHDERSLLRILGLRGMPHVVPRSDAGVFGPGAVGADEDSLREQLGPACALIEGPDRTAREALGAVLGVLAAVLADAEPRTKGELSEALHGRVDADLEPWCDACDVHHVPDPLLRLAGMAGIFCYGWPYGDRQMLTATDIWLGEPLGGDVRSGRVELARRFVHAYGPVAPRHFASWTGIGTAEARDRFLDLGSELVEVRLDGMPNWVLAADLDVVRDPPLAGGARLLPPGDPFLAQRDRSTLVPDRAVQRAVWRPVGSPGLVLISGHPVATWRSRVMGPCLEVTVDAFGALGDRQRMAVEQEAGVLALFRGQGDVGVRFT